MNFMLHTLPLLSFAISSIHPFSFLSSCSSSRPTVVGSLSHSQHCCLCSSSSSEGGSQYVCLSDCVSYISHSLQSLCYLIFLSVEQQHCGTLAYSCDHKFKIGNKPYQDSFFLQNPPQAKAHNLMQTQYGAFNSKAAQTYGQTSNRLEFSFPNHLHWPYGSKYQKHHFTSNNCSRRQSTKSGFC